MLAVTENVYGERLVPYKATLFEKSGKANWLVAWHQDTSLPLETSPNSEGWGPASKKDGVNFLHAPIWALAHILALRIHLDPSMTINGPLRVIPASHKQRFHNDADIEQMRKSSCVVECLVGKGGVVAMSPMILHASSKIRGDSPRLVLHIEYATSLELSPDIHLAIA